MIGDKEYSFKMTNRTIRKIDETYGNYGSVEDGLMNGKQFYTNALKLVSMSCISKDKENKSIEWSLEELEDIITSEQYKQITELATLLYCDYIGIDLEAKQENGENEKNKEKN